MNCLIRNPVFHFLSKKQKECLVNTSFQKVVEACSSSIIFKGRLGVFNRHLPKNWRKFPIKQFIVLTAIDKSCANRYMSVTKTNSAQLENGSKHFLYFLKIIPSVKIGVLFV